MNRKNTWPILAVTLLIAAAAPLCAGKKTAIATPSVKKGDPPPGNAMALSIPRARAMLKEAMKKKYVGRMYGGPLLGSMTGNVEEATDVHVRASGLDLVAPFTWARTHNEGKYSVDFKKVDYVQAYSFKYGQVFYCVGFLPHPRRAALGWSVLNGFLSVQFVWSDEVDAQKFADAFNRLLYAAYRNEGPEELQAFSAAARTWRENPVKPPLSPEADRHRILAENAIQEKNLDSAIEHYESAVEVQPMWPAGWFNLAMIYAEQNNYVDAADRMKHYLELVPDAPDARDARTQMIIWEDKAARH